MSFSVDSTPASIARNGGECATMGRVDIDRRAGRIASQVDGPILAAAAFEPNVVTAAGPGLAALNAFGDERRRSQAIAEGTGLARQSLLVVTNREIIAFDVDLSRWGLVRLLAQWPRAEVAASAVAVATPFNPLRAPDTGPVAPALRIQDRSGAVVAELRPDGWGADHRRLYETLTGFPGWSPGSGRADPKPLTILGLIGLIAILAGLFAFKASDDEGPLRDRAIAVAVATTVLAVPLVVAYIRHE